MSDLILTVPGARLRAVEVGGDGPLTIVLHGGPGASLDYLRPQLDRLAIGRRLLYYDQRGGGRSQADDPSAPVTAELLAAELDDLRQVLGLRRVTLVGYSWGGLLALLYATRHPERLDRLLLVSTAPARFAWRGPMEKALAERSARSSVRALKEEADVVRASDPVCARRLRFAAAVGGYFVDARRSLEMTPFLVTTRTQRSVWKSLGDYDLLPMLGRIVAPALLIHGAQDPVPPAGAREIFAALPHARLVVLPDASHVPFIEDAEACFAEMDDFLPRSGV